MSPIVPLNLPKTELKITRSDGQLLVRCLVRKKNIVLTPEEWVRQHCIAYFFNELAYPKGLLTVEKKLNTEQWKKDGIWRYSCPTKSAFYYLNVKPQASQLQKLFLSSLWPITRDFNQGF